MPLTAGAHLGPYEILATIGAGGMGEVYRARDTTLNRDVAIKVIPNAFAHDRERIARFEREAHALAAINHPNIAQIYGLQSEIIHDQPPFAFIVMELVEGEELTARIIRGPLSLEEAMPIATQIADALEAAHEQGIVHRDLKPANIKIRPDGIVKLLDFGLAKAIDPGVASGSTATMSPTVQATQAGIILGTAAYMSPEQARGKPVDKRADIWAFGVVVYEMVTGRKPFQGDDVVEVLAGVINEQPSWNAVPAQLLRLLQRCLEKDPKKRLRDISGVALLLEEPSAPARRRTPQLAWIAAGTLTVVAAVALALWLPSRGARPESRPLVQLSVDLGADGSLGSPQGTDAIISPGGDRLVWVSRNRLFTRRLDQPKAVQLWGDQPVDSPFFSPDGAWVAFFSAGTLRKVSVEGGAAMALCDAARGRGGTWGEDGRITVSVDGALSTLPEAGGKPTPLTQLSPGDGEHFWPQVIRGGEAVLFTVRGEAGSYDDANIGVVTIRDGRRKTVLRGGMFGRYMPAANGSAGHLLYINRGTLFAVPFDLDRLEVRGTPWPVVEDVAYNNSNGSAQFDASRTGTLVYRAGAGAARIEIGWLDGSGNTHALPAKPAGYTQPRLSPDGGLLALSIVDAGGQDIWIYDWQRDAMSRLTSDGASYSFPVWSPDGRYIVFTGGFASGGMLWTRADGASKPQRLTESKNGQFPWSFSPDGKHLAFNECQAGRCDLWTVPVDTDRSGLKAGKPDAFLRTSATEVFPAFSPDGRWIAFRTLESGTSEIQVRAFPDKGSKWLISNNGGAIPVWSPNGRELFYRTEDQRIMVVAYTVKRDVFVADKPRLWSEKRLTETQFGQVNLDIAPDGKRFVVTMAAAEERRTLNQVIFLQNFSDELRRRVGSAK